MSVDFNATPMNSTTNSESDTPMFAPVPAWERSRKRGGMFGGGKSRSSVGRAQPPVETAAAAADAAYAGPLDPIDTDTSSFAAAPAFASRTVKKGRTGLPLAVAAGLVAIGGLAAAGWYATQPHESGMAQLTPGTESNALPAPTNELATNTTPAPMPAEATPAPAEAAAPAAKPAPRVSTRVAAAAPARARPAPASRSASDAGVNTAATLPSAPQPYSGTATADVAPAPAAPKWNIPPAATTPAPAPVEAAPSVTPPAAATPPVQTPPN